MSVQWRIASHQRNVSHYNLRRRPYNFAPDRHVWRKNKSQSDIIKYFGAKLAPQYVGPLAIKRKTGTCTFELEDSSKISLDVLRVQVLKPVIIDSG